ncbi:MAG: kelch repeat-containing protein [bacterium]|nr:kelch repeat-containing protein [bacterium]
MRLVIGVVLFLCFCREVTYGGAWDATGSFNMGRRGYEMAVLTDGRIVVFGGSSDANGYEIFNPATGTWIRKTMSTSNSGHTFATTLPNGKVLYIVSSAFIYNPFTDIFTNSSASISWSTSDLGTLLKNGKVLFMNGTSSSLYNYKNDAVTTSGNIGVSHNDGVEILLPSGKVLAIGGYSSSTTACNLYDTSSGQWSTTGAISGYRYGFVGVLLPPPWDKVLIAGGSTVSSQQCELYDISVGTWSVTGSLNSGPKTPSALALLPSGKVLVAGGDNYPQSCEIYDPSTGQWTNTTSSSFGHSHYSMAILPTGKVLSAGGSLSDIANCEIYDPIDGKWLTAPELQVEREAQTVTPLPIIHTSNCSTNVLIVGGENLGGAVKTCELYNYSKEIIANTGDLNTARTHHTAVLLASGEVLVMGGQNSSGATKTCELYNPATGVWTNKGDMIESRYDHTSTLLGDGDKIIVTGGINKSGDYVNTCETYNNGSWNSAGNMNTARANHMAIMLMNGKILVIGGTGSSGILNSCEIWDSTTGNWQATGNLITGRCLHTAVLLQSGKVLVMGGKSSTGQLSSCEIYDPLSGTWSTAGTMKGARMLHNATLLYSGLVLVSGGCDATGSLSSCELYDPATQQWKLTGSLGSARNYHSSVLITGESPYIIVVGGESNGQILKSVEKYDIGLGYQQIWQSSITNYPAVTHIPDTAMHIEGTLFRGVSEADGGNYCHIVSSDHPIMSLVRIGGGNWQGNGGGDMLYMPPSSEWDETHTIIDHPANAPKGYYRLWTIVNGIPTIWYKTCMNVEENSNSQSVIHNPQIELSPNPSKEKVIIKFNTKSGCKVLVNIYDCSGRHLKEIEQNYNTPGNKSIDLQQKLKSGIYFYNVKIDGNKSFTGKFIIL